MIKKLLLLGGFICIFCIFFLFPTHTLLATQVEHIDIPINEYIHFSSDTPTNSSSDTRMGVINGVTHYLLFKPSSPISLPAGSTPLYYEFITNNPISISSSGYKARLGIWFHCNDPQNYAYINIEECIIYNQGDFVVKDSGTSVAYADYALSDALSHYVGFEYQEGHITINPTNTYWRVYYEPSQSQQIPTPTVRVSIPGDANNDALVNKDDYVIWRANYLKQTLHGTSEGDFNSDSFVDGFDYVTWLMHSSL